MNAQIDNVFQTNSYCYDFYNLYNADLHIILLKSLEDKEISQRLIDTLYDKLSRRYATDLVDFKFNDYDKTFDIKLNRSTRTDGSTGVTAYEDIKNIYGLFVQSLFCSDYTLNILRRYDTDGNINRLLENYDLSAIARNCITILNFSTDPNFVILKVKLHN